ncbi:hypothetical protein [Streptosporangium saharense]|uniref:hypothetical protein n=2 Tax=Streptosporangium saharense TaxID=1706840 RepID=UPI0036868A6B
MPSYPMYNLKLAGWRNQSVWGWDPALETWYAQLTHDSAGYDAMERGPQIWLSPPRVPVISTPAALAVKIAKVTRTEVAAVRTAMNDSLPGRHDPLWLPEEEPHPGTGHSFGGIIQRLIPRWGRP